MPRKDPFTRLERDRQKARELHASRSDAALEQFLLDCAAKEDEARREAKRWEKAQDLASIELYRRRQNTAVTLWIGEVDNGYANGGIYANVADAKAAAGIDDRLWVTYPDGEVHARLGDKTGDRAYRIAPTHGGHYS